jgi:hypothetical protein
LPQRGRNRTGHGFTPTSTPTECRTTGMGSSASPPSGSHSGLSTGVLSWACRGTGITSASPATAIVRSLVSTTSQSYPSRMSSFSRLSSTAGRFTRAFAARVARSTYHYTGERESLRRCPIIANYVARREKVRVIPVGASPTRLTQSLQPEAIGAAAEVTKPPKPSRQTDRLGGPASRQAVTRVNAEQASKEMMWEPTRQHNGEGRRHWQKWGSHPEKRREPVVPPG